MGDDHRRQRAVQVRPAHEEAVDVRLQVRAPHRSGVAACVDEHGVVRHLQQHRLALPHVHHVRVHLRGGRRRARQQHRRRPSEDGSRVHRCGSIPEKWVDLPVRGMAGWWRGRL